jgi:8-oxo-dGTP diphosphatase
LSSSAEAARHDALERGLAVSAKAIVLDGDRVLLVRNYRNEWELPGGRPDDGESLAAAAVREVREETGLESAAGAFVDSWDYEIAVENAVVRVISFAAMLTAQGAIVLSEEHDAFGWHPLDRLADLDMPDGYKRSIRLAAAS